MILSQHSCLVKNRRNMQQKLAVKFLRRVEFLLLLFGEELRQNFASFELENYTKLNSGVNETLLKYFFEMLKEILPAGRNRKSTRFERSE